uniref:E-beta-farnesene synthase n=1 Tax=Tanacetum cinerariifolium TaxID=118510 RepID=A0A6L2KU33_TANCI|nr:E-beta-farnesene synthase [Tanacetum cinerariifolium]
MGTKVVTVAATVVMVWWFGGYGVQRRQGGAWGCGGGYVDGSCGGCSGGFGGGGWRVVESDMVDLIDRVMGSLFGFAENARRKVFWWRPEVVAGVAGWPAVGDTIADVNVNAPADQAPTMAPPTRTDDQIPPHIRWVPIGKSNSYLDVEKSQINPIYKIMVDILKHTNFFRAFTASSTIPSIYIQQALTTIINLCLKGKTLGFERPRAPMLQILWDKKNLAHHTHGKNKATLIVISSIRFTNLIIYHLQRKYKFHPRPDSPLYLPNEEPVLGYLKFSAKGTKREVFGMPIPGNLITADIQGESYYQEYLAKVAKHQRYLTGETRSDPDSPAPNPTKTTKKSKPTTPKADPRLPVSKSASSQQSEPKPTPAKTQGKKRKLVTEISDKPSQARKSRSGLVSKQRKPISSLRSVDESVVECIPKKEPRVNDEEADVQRALEESLKSIYDVPRGPLPLVVIRELESGKYQLLLEVQGKRKEKVTEEQVARNLLTLQTPKKKSHVDQYIFQRHTSAPTGSSSHDESSSLYVELGLTDSEVESDEDVSRIDAGVHGKGQARPNPDDQDEGQAGPNPDEQVKGQAGPKPGDVEASHPLPSPVVHAGSDLEHMDLDVADVLPQPHPEQMDEGFTATAYPKVQDNLKLTVKEHVIPEEPTSSTRTLSSLQHLTKDLSFGDLFFNDKPSEANNEKTTAQIEAESMVSITIQLDTSAIPPMTTPVVDLTLRPESPIVHRPLHAMATEITTTTTTTPPSQPQQSTIDSVLMKCISKLEHIMANLIRENKHLEERNLPEANMKEMFHQRMWETNSYKTHEDHKMMYEALEKSMNRDHSKELAKDLAEVRKKKKKRRDSPKTPPGSPPHQPPPPPPAGPSKASGYPGAFISSQVPPPPPPPPSTNQEGQSKGSAAPSSSKTAASAEYQAWTTTDTRLMPSLSLTLTDLQMDDDMALDAQAQSFDDEDIRNGYIPKASALTSTYSPPPKDSLLAQTECHKLLTDSVDESILRHNVSKPLPLGSPPGQVIIQSDFFFNKDLEYLRYGSKGSRPALLITKMKVAYYPDVGLEQMVPDQMWIEEECKYDIAAIAVRTHMRILSVVKIEVFSMYGYDYMKKIVLRRADLNEHIITERYFKYLYPSDFEDLYLLNLQGHLNHLPPKDKKILTTAVNLWTRHLVIRQRVEDFQLGIESYQT